MSGEGGNKIGGGSVLSPEVTESDRVSKSSPQSKKSRTTSCESDDYTSVLEAKIAQLEEKLLISQNANASGVKIEPGTSSGSVNIGSIRRHESTSSLGDPSPLSGSTTNNNPSPENSSGGGLGSGRSGTGTTPAVGSVSGAANSGSGTGGGSGSSSVRMRGRGGTTVSILNVDPENEGVAPQSFTVVSSLLQETYWGQNKSDEADIGGPPNSSGGGASGGGIGTGNSSIIGSPIVGGTGSYSSSVNNTPGIGGSNNPAMDVDSADSHIENGSSPRKSIGNTIGMLPDYNFEEYLNYKPAKPPDKQTGDTLLNSFLAGSQGRFPFVDRNLLLKTHEKRFDQPPTLDCPKYRFANFLLFTSYAIASVSHTPTQGENPEFEPFGYYSTALQHAKMCNSDNIMWHITTLIMCAMFQMRTDKDKGCHYDMVRRSMKICVEINLHKSAGLNKMTKYEQEICKRLFWSVYSLERLFAISTGRPFVMDEKEIDITFPCDMDDIDLLDESKIVENEKYRDSGAIRPTTSMTFIIYIWRLRRLESDLVQAIYRVDRSIEERFSHVDYYLGALKEWKESNRVITPKEQNITNTAYSRDIRLLLQPFLGRLSPDSDLFQMCVRETGHICQIFRDFYRKKESGFTTMAMHTNFVAGLTLVYCLWLAKDSSILPILENVRSCTAALYVLTERSRLCMNYRDTFENLVSTTMKHIIEHRRQKRHRREAEEMEHQRLLEEQEQEKQRELARLHKEEEEQRRLRERIEQERLEIERQRLQQQQQQQLIKQEAGDTSGPIIMDDSKSLHRTATTHVPSTSSIASTSSTFPVIDRSPYLPTTSINTTSGPSNISPPIQALPGPAIPDTAASFAQLQPHGGPTGGPHPTSINFGGPSGMELQKDWIEAYGYDDTLYNMIQDISSWTKQVGDAHNQAVTTDATTANGTVNTTSSDTAGWFNDNTTDNAWMNISDFGYS